MRPLKLVALGISLGASHLTLAQEAPNPGASATNDSPAATATGASPTTQLPPVKVEEKPWLFNKDTRYSHLLPEVEETTLLVTKKNTVIQLDQQPTVINNNQRELFAHMPGLVISEQQNPGQVNIGYRGIGGNGALGTQESELLLSLQDGIPIASDWIGFPTQYYIPVPQSIASVTDISKYNGAPMKVGSFFSPFTSLTTGIKFRLTALANNCSVRIRLS